MYVGVGRSVWRNICRGGKECMWGWGGMYVGVGRSVWRNVCRGGEEYM